MRVSLMSPPSDGLADADWSVLTVDTLRTLLRGLRQWRAAVEDIGLTEIVDSSGQEWVIWDVEAIFYASQNVLPVRQSQAISMFLVDGMRERDVAISMGISPTNPIGMYATDGLRTLVFGIQDGSILLRHRGSWGT